MDAVGLEQRTRRFVVAFGFDPLHLAEQVADAFAKRMWIDHDVIRLAVAPADVDRGGVGDQPVDDHLTIAHVIFFDVRPLADTPKLHERVARVALVLGADDLGVILVGDEPELDQLRIRQEVQRDEVGARLFERGVLLPERRLRVPLQPLLDSTGAVSDHFVHVSGQLAGKRVPLRRALGFLRSPRELAAKLRQRGLVVRLIDVGQQY